MKGIATRNHAFIGALPLEPLGSTLCESKTAVCGEIVAALASGSTAGAVILGETGVGKTFLMQHASQRLAEHACVIHLRGSAFGSRVRYGALSILLSELDESVLDRPLQILEGLTRLLQERARGREVILAVDNADQLDEFSVMVIGQLVSSQTVRILAVCNEAFNPPHEFAVMCRANAMDRFEIGPLTQDDTALLLKELLGSPISREAVATLFRHSHGNPRWLAMLGHDYVQCGSLSLHHGVWVRTNQAFQMGSGTRDSICDALNHLTPAQRLVVEMIAAAQHVPLMALQRCSESSDLDVLQEQGLVTLATDRALTVSLTSGLLAEAVSGGMLASRRLELCERLAEAARAYTAEQGHSTAASTTMRQAPTEEDHTRQRGEFRVASARAASYEGRYVEVLELLHVNSPELDALQPEVRALTGAFIAEALAMTGRPYDALALAESAVAVIEAQQHPLAGQAAQALANLDLAAGVWTAAPSSLHRTGTGHSALGSTQSELADGLLLAFAGNFQEALDFLVPALRQCEAGDLPGMGALASAAASYCSAALGRPIHTSSFSASVAKRSNGTPWLVRRLTKHFAILTAAHFGSRERAAREMLAVSKQDRSMGVSATELLSLSGALRLGERAAIEPLLSTSARCQGDFARLCELYAKATDNLDLQLMLQVMDFARDHGHVSFALDAAESARQFAVDGRRKSSSRQAHRRIEATLAGSGEHSYGDRVLSTLTQREVEVVHMIVEGKSNKRIARQLDVSVRTVEGHLYQVYSKLHVRNREALTALVAADQSKMT